MDKNTTTMLRNGYFVPFHEDEEKATPVQAIAAAVEMLECGYMVEPDMIMDMSLADLTRMVVAAKDIAYGVFAHMKALYPMFPHEVKLKTEHELLFDQMRHYNTQGTDHIQTTMQDRGELPDEDKFLSSKQVNIITVKEAVQVFTDVATQSRAVGDQQRDLLHALCNHKGVDSVDLQDALVKVVETAPISENIGTSAYALRDKRADTITADYAVRVINAAKRPDDVIRVFRAFYDTSDKGEDLHELIARFDNKYCTFNPIPRKVRRAVTERLIALFHSNKRFGADPYMRRRDTYKRILGTIHPYEFARGKDRKLLDILTGNVKYTTLNSVYENKLASGDYAGAAEVLADHSPGQLARNAVNLVSMDESGEAVGHVERALGSSKMTTIVSLVNAVRQNQNNNTKIRSIAGQCNQIVETTQMDEDKAEQLENACVSAIRKKLEKHKVNNVTLGTKNADYPVPLNVRDLSVSDRGVQTRGMRTKMDNPDNTIRMFLHWIGRFDLDLGIIATDKYGNALFSVDYISYNSYRDFVTFSGDIVDAPNGASEYFDVDIHTMKQQHKDVKYIIMSVINYSGSNLKDVNHRCGVMARSDVNAGEIFDPRTVINTMTTTQPGVSMITCAFDVDTYEMIIGDINSGYAIGGLNTSDPNIRRAAKEAVNPSDMKVVDILQMASDMWGVPTDDTEEVDTDLLGDILNM